MVDGVVELSDTLMGVRTVRQLQVRKSRGSHALGGLHKFEISGKGVTVYPRIETLYAETSNQEIAELTRISCGVPGLDTMMGGGIPRGSVTLITGPSGSGKTTLGLHFLAQAKVDEPALHFGFFENEQRLRLKATSIGLTLPPPDTGELTVMCYTLAENLLDRLAHELIDHVQAHGIKRLFIDGLGGFERAAVHRAHLTEFFATLTGHLRQLGVTTVATWEIRELVGGDVSAPTANLSAILDNLILLRQFEENHDLQRSISIQKMRESAFDTAAHRLSFASDGFLIGDRLGVVPTPPAGLV